MNANPQSYSVRHFLVSAAALAVIAIGMQWGASIVLPLVMILYVTALMAPLYGWMQRKGVPKWLAIIGLILLLIGIAVALFWLVYYSFGRLLGNLSDMEGQFSARLSALGAPMGEGANAGSTPTLQTEIERVTLLIQGFLIAALGQMASLIAQGAIILVAVVLILLDSAGISSTLDRLLSQNKSLTGVRQLPANLVNYFIARTEVNLVTGAAIAFFLLIMRVDYAILWAVLAFALSYIPYIGLFVAAIPAVVLAFVEYGPISAVIVIIGYIVLNQVAEVILEPKITGARLSLKPWFVFLAMFVFAWLMGPAGVLLAGPLTVFTMILFSMFDDTRWILDLIVTEKPPADAAEVAAPEEAAT